ncbi:MAG: UbiA prenyltransferase family protein [Ruminococcus callidus]|nr:UbiA prenyltransferase family protein [Ruminococcus callidus]
MKKYIKLMRVKHYIKNLLIFVSLFFAKGIFETEKLLAAVMGFLSFCLISSAVYIINDINDIEKDRNHPTKCNRPLASGAVSKKQAIVLLVICIAVAVFLSLLTSKFFSLIYVAVYFVLNVLYSFILKNYPIIDIVILTSGFVLRVLYGAYITNTVISSWLFLVIVSGSFYLGLGKRRAEIELNADSRKVLKYYNYAFLDKNMYVCFALVAVFYALWAKEFSNPYMIYSVPLVFVILMKYSLDIEGDYDGDPVEVILKDKWLIFLSIIYIILVSILLYLV